MKSLLLLLSIVCSIAVLQAQGDSDILASADKQISKQAALSWTLGDYLTQSMGTSARATQKFHHGRFDIQTYAADPMYEQVFALYPVQEDEALQLKSITPFTGNYVIIDLYGRILKQSAMNGDAQIEVSSIPEGVYILQILKDQRIVFVARVEKL